MRICHSLWTNPLLDKRDVKQLTDNIWLYALSFTYARKLADNIVLHTDINGEKLLNFIPYDKMYLSLEKLRTPSCFWAAGKIQAQFLEPIGSLHIDGDVFLKNTNLKKLLNFDNYDLIAQHIEPLDDIYINPIMIFNVLFNAVPETVYKPTLKFEPYNCGIIGFNNESLKSKYINSYFKALNYYSKNVEFIKLCNDNSEHFTPDIILEQLLLGTIAGGGNYKTKLLLNSNDIYTEATNIDYSHLIGTSKQEQIEDVKKRLHEIDPHLFSLAQKKISDLRLETTNRNCK